MYNIPLFKIHTDQADIDAVSEVIRSGRSWAIGPQIEAFEKALASYVGVNHALTFSSGTAALHALMLAYGFGPGDEIIVPSFTFIATSNAPLFVGATPVFAEIETTTFGLDPSDIEKKITKNTKAIMVLHYAGNPCLIEEIKKIADKHNLILLEDAAGALGSKVNDRNIGTFGDSAMFSFCGPKAIATGEGGAIVTNNIDLVEKLKLIRSHGRLETKDYFSSPDYLDYIELGYNFRMSSMTAALGLSQLNKIETILALRKKHAEYLNEKLASISQIRTPKAVEGSKHIYQLYTIHIKEGSEVRNKLKDHLNSKGIFSKVYFEPVHLAGYYQKELGYQKGDLPVTEKIASEVLTLPMYPDLTKEEMDAIVQEVLDFFKNQ